MLSDAYLALLFQTLITSWRSAYIVNDMLHMVFVSLADFRQLHTICNAREKKT
jgi:hypothetical protein